ncbi:MAG: pyridoxamine 5'-phosphate oxidase family protein [Planctomycetaceae bacterium]|nr:pyridoxamine 5'-phosphate oxidase family protein [Planctomycetaceae bacterium]
MTSITSIADLEAIYGVPSTAAAVKVSDRLTPEYRALLEASVFLCLATVGPEGVDCSPRGDRKQLVRVESETCVLLPDRRGNNRIDSLRNVVRDPRLALLVLLPGSGTTLRINGTGSIHADPELLESFAVDGQAPRTVLKIQIDQAYFQCARAIVRSGLWDPDHHVSTTELPGPGQILQAMSDGEIDGRAYDREWPERARRTLW